jgi:hypothetical protein
MFYSHEARKMTMLSLKKLCVEDFKRFFQILPFKDACARKSTDRVEPSKSVFENWYLQDQCSRFVQHKGQVTSGNQEMLPMYLQIHKHAIKS